MSVVMKENRLRLLNLGGVKYIVETLDKTWQTMTDHIEGYPSLISTHASNSRVHEEDINPSKELLTLLEWQLGSLWQLCSREELMEYGEGFMLGAHGGKEDASAWTRLKQALLTEAGKEKAEESVKSVGILGLNLLLDILHHVESHYLLQTENGAQGDIDPFEEVPSNNEMERAYTKVREAWSAVAQTHLPELTCALLTTVTMSSVHHNDGSVGLYLVQNGVLDILPVMIKGTTVPISARVHSAQLYLMLSSTPKGREQVPAGAVAGLLILMLESNSIALQETGARGCAIFAAEGYKTILAEAGGIEILVQHAKRPNTMMIREMAVKALLNLSSAAENQVEICKRSLYLMLRLNQDEISNSELKMYTSAVLQNLSSCAGNRTRIYKAELRMKGGSVVEMWQQSDDWRLDRQSMLQEAQCECGPVPELSTISFYRDAEDVEEPEAHTLKPRVKLENRNGSVRYAKDRLQTSMCKPISQMWSPITVDTYGVDPGKMASSTRWQPKVVGYRPQDWKGEGLTTSHKKRSAAGMKTHGKIESGYKCESRAMRHAALLENAEAAKDTGASSLQEENAWMKARPPPAADLAVGTVCCASGFCLGGGGRFKHGTNGWGAAEPTAGGREPRRRAAQQVAFPRARRLPRPTARLPQTTPGSPRRSGGLPPTPRKPPSPRPTSAMSNPNPHRSTYRPPSHSRGESRPQSAVGSPEGPKARPQSALPSARGGRAYSTRQMPEDPHPPLLPDPSSKLRQRPQSAVARRPDRDRGRDASVSPNAGSGHRQTPLRPSSQAGARPASAARPGSASRQTPGEKIKQNEHAFQFKGAKVTDYPEMKLYLEPHSRHHPVNFKGRITIEQLRKEVAHSTKGKVTLGDPPSTKDRMYMFEAVDGSKYAESLFPVYLLPDGRKVHYYHEPRRFVDGVDVFWDDIPMPLTLPAVMQATLPDVGEVFAERLNRAQTDSGQGANLSALTSLCEKPPRPSRHTIQTKPHKCSAENCPEHGKLEDIPMRICVHLEELPEPEPEPEPEVVEPFQDEKKVEVETAVTRDEGPIKLIGMYMGLPHDIGGEWNLDKTVFLPRKPDSDQRDYWDREEVMGRMFDTDWDRLSCHGERGRFMKMISNNGENAEMIEGVRTMLRDHYDMLAKIFDYYCCLGSGTGHFSMQTNEWSQFLKDAAILDNAPRSKTKRVDCDSIFIVANQVMDPANDAEAKPEPKVDGKGGWLKAKAAAFNKERKEAVAKRNAASLQFDKLSMMRCEFLAGVIKLAIAKFIEERKWKERDVPKAVDMLCRQIHTSILATRPEALLVANDFRSIRLYTPAVERLLIEEMNFFQTVYNYYKGSSQNPENFHLMQLEGWVHMFEHAQVIGYATGMSVRELTLCFSWSRMMYVDEVISCDNRASLTFVDFMEAFGRVADFLSPPPIEQLQEMCMENAALARAVGATESRDAEPWDDFGPTFTFYSILANNRGVDQRKMQIDRRPSADGFLQEKTRPLEEKLRQLIDWMVGGLCKKHGERTKAALISRLNLVPMFSAGVGSNVRGTKGGKGQPNQTKSNAEVPVTALPKGRAQNADCTQCLRVKANQHSLPDRDTGIRFSVSLRGKTIV
ncbi:hypothetical protein CYMTET_7106 [Cymbomonas tetramitiformis]|uniref:Uncharacterized protein n=1 Tax=Cymbomonas tetramitiformis TaxID=36881 RepID=A0AAE0GVM6_9CHLO|nr:hypothetical protein CYMTET_7106 [Cymbomonas tetramitiformis]